MTNRHAPTPQPNGFLVCIHCGLQIVEWFAAWEGDHEWHLRHKRRTKMYGPAY